MVSCLIIIKQKSNLSCVVKTLRDRSGFGIPGRSNRTQCLRRLATGAMFLRSCVAQAQSREMYSVI